MLSINMSENRSSVQRYGGWDGEKYEALMQIPVKANNDYYTIADINNNGSSISGDSINLLCVVRKVGLFEAVLHFLQLLYAISLFSYIYVYSFTRYVCHRLETFVNARAKAIKY